MAVVARKARSDARHLLSGGPAEKLARRGIDPAELGGNFAQACKLVFADKEPVRTVQGECEVYDINHEFYSRFGKEAAAFNEEGSHLDKVRRGLIASPEMAAIDKAAAGRGFRKAAAIAAKARFGFSIAEFEIFDRFCGRRMCYANMYTPLNGRPAGGYPLAMVLPGLQTTAHMYDLVARLLVGMGYKVMVVDRPPDMMIDVMVEGLPVAFYAAIHAAGMRDVDCTGKGNVVVGFSEGSARGPALQGISRVQGALELGVELPLFPNGVFFSGPYYMKGMFERLQRLTEEGSAPWILRLVEKQTRKLGITADKTHREPFWWEISPRLYVIALEKGRRNAAWGETRVLPIGGKADPIIPPRELFHMWADLTMLGAEVESVYAVEGPGIHPDPSGVNGSGVLGYMRLVLEGVKQMAAGTVDFLEKIR